MFMLVNIVITTDKISVMHVCFSIQIPPLTSWSCNYEPTENWSLSLNTFLSVIWGRTTNLCIMWRHFNSEAYPSGLSEPSGRPTEVLHCFVFERHAMFHNVDNKKHH